VSTPALPREDLEGFWPGRRLDAFDGLCPGVAPSRAPDTSG
jgi:hypothetical protein